MRVPLSWLKDFVDIQSKPEEIANSLSMSGFEVEEIIDHSKELEGVVIGFVNKLRPHPEADKLKICEIDVGDEVNLQIVCGAKNIKEGIYVPVAKIGTTLNTINLVIKATKLRGIDSNGMVCSKYELGLEEYSEGIYILDDSNTKFTKKGAPITEALQIEDVIFDIAITANRPDGMSIKGIAREISAIYNLILKQDSVEKNIKLQKTKFNNINSFIESDSFYAITNINGLNTTKSTKDKIKKRLEACCIRTINPIVDITNYIMLETGQPLHAFDAELLRKLCNKDIVHDDFDIRSAYKGEIFTTIDNKIIELNDDETLVTCSNIPIAIAGVIGSNNSSVNENTTSIWLESGVFKQKDIRNSSRSTGIRTESSTRYEKGIPGGITLEAFNRSIKLLKDQFLKLDYQGYYIGSLSTKEIIINLRIEKIKNTLGTLKNDNNSNKADKVNSKLALHPKNTDIIKNLEKIGCNLKETDYGWNVEIPKYRNKDLTREIDLIEEIARLIGYDKFNSFLPDPIKPGYLSSIQRTERSISRNLCSIGFQEVNTISLVSNNELCRFKVPITNPLLKETSHLRVNLWDEHINIIQRNIKNGIRNVWIFEVGNVYQYNMHKNDNINNKQILGGIIYGNKESNDWQNSSKDKELNYFHARGLIQTLFNQLKVDVEDIKNSDDSTLHPGRSAILNIEGRAFGKFGQIHPELSDRRQIPKSTYIFELDLTKLLAASTRENKINPVFKKYSTYPSMERDISLIVEEDVKSSDITKLIRKNGKKILEDIRLLDRFENISNDRRKTSLTYRLKYRKKDSTLTEEEIMPIHEKILSELERKLSITIRM